MIAKLPGKYEQMLGRRFETGVDLSGGEWQKLALARAYLRDAQLLILDEPTAALDARSEFEVFERFAELTEGKMALFISHRFSTVRMADRIVVLAGGQIAEEGSHEQLVALGGRTPRCLSCRLRAIARMPELTMRRYQPSRRAVQETAEPRSSRDRDDAPSHDRELAAARARVGRSGWSGFPR